MRSTYFLGLLAAGLVAMAAGCGDDGSSTGGTGGSAGSPGTGGSGNTGGGGGPAGDGNDTFEDADAIDFPSQTPGSLDPTDKDEDYYIFNGVAGAPIVIQVDAKPDMAPTDPTYVDTVITLYDAQHNKVAENDDPILGVINDSLLFTYLPADGSYYVRVTECNVLFPGNCAPLADITTKTYTLYLDNINPDLLVTEMAGGPTAIEITGMPNSYADKLATGMLSMDVENDVYTFTLPSDVAYDPMTQRPVSSVTFFASGPNGNGSSTDIQLASIRDVATGNIVAQVNPSFPDSDLFVPLIPGASYELLLEHVNGTVGANPFYFAWFFPEQTSNPVENELLNGVTNDALLDAEALVGQPVDTSTRYFVEGDITVAGTDVDFFQFATMGQPKFTLVCGARRSGSGLRDLTVQVFDANGVELTGVTATETENQNALLSQIDVPAGNNTLAFRIEAPTQDPNVTSNFYRCGVTVFTPAP